MRRPRLLEPLRQFTRTDLRLLTLWAVAGAGKSTALADWAAALESDGARVRWLTEADLLLDADVPLDGDGTVDWWFVDDVNTLFGGQCPAPLRRLLSMARADARIVVAGRFEPTGFGSVVDTLGGQMVVPPAALAFTVDETLALALRFDLVLPVQDAETLAQRTGGWAAGVVLAMPFLLTQTDRAAAVARFGGDHHQVADYLTVRILDTLSAADRAVVMRAAVASEVPLDLAVTLTGRNDVGAVLQRLSARHLFVEAAPDGDGFRIHPVLAAYMRAEFRRRDECSAVRNHATAAEWYEQLGAHDLAMEQALLSRDPLTIATQVERSGSVLLMQGRTTLIGTALSALPLGRDTLPVAAIRLAMDAPAFPDRIGAEECLARAESLLATASATEDRRWRPVVLALSTFLITDDVAAGARLRELGEFLRGTPIPSLDTALVLRAAVAWCLIATGQRDDAEQLLRSVQAAALRAGYGWLYVIAVDASATLAVRAGDWRTASAHEERMNIVRFDTTPPYNRATARAMLLTTMQAYARCEPVSFAALHRIEAADPTGAELGLLFQVRVVLCVAAIDASAAPREPLARLVQLVRTDGRAHPRTVAAVSTRLHSWSQTLHGPAAAADIRRLVAGILGPDSLEANTLRLLAAGRTDHLASAAVAEAVDGRDAAWTGVSVVHAHLALAAHAEQQVRPLEVANRVRRALDISEEFGFAREFLASRNAGADLVRALRGSFGPLEDYASHITSLAATAAGDTGTGQQQMAVALTAKEQELLLELPAHQTIAEIAAKHHLSVNTIKTHLRSVYAKLSASGRTEAVTAARLHGLL
ncbi:LuxR C-terminal-related transcriptional regulator [Curtobacterium sp. MCLR17_051]|uniref:LuxR C-terminal-related transcriptional regulator n=1 Tax=Curtobacterium sp. MCLR17_051 TaxID=2175630 RepID=UPI000DA8C521|nr:LuxR C-terminal-related transcriptional regulator [Curtobacterium sp. MCLR17_051]PZF39451.1 hypothetical protein DEJ07_12450 [Curtobacterium sp. MCLR17_053]PZF48482.1 hypothetical protein DEJ06_12765 [Curtobacterium sp. MCLR17_051]